MSKDAQLLRAMGMGPEERPGFWRYYGLETEKRLTFDLGLDLAPSEWTVEHDAAFARVVWPWLRDRKNVVIALRVYKALPVVPSPADPDPFGEWAMSENPGPTMCQAIYSVLCGDKTD